MTRIANIMTLDKNIMMNHFDKMARVEEKLSRLLDEGYVSVAIYNEFEVIESLINHFWYKNI